MVKTAQGAGGEKRPKTAKVVSVVAVGGYGEATLLAMAARSAGSLEARLAAAIAESAGESDVPTAPVAGQQVALGNARVFAELGLPLDALGDGPARLESQGQRVLFVAVGGRTAGFLGIAMPADEEAAQENKERDMSINKNLFLAGPAFASLAGVAAAAPGWVDLADGGRFDLRIVPVTRTIGGNTLRMLGYNGSIPGPTLRVKQGSEIEVRVVNDGDVEATVHWHGLRLDNRYDGTLATQPPIPLGGSFTYRLAFPDPGVYWYHPHIREDYGQEMGLYGNIVVVPAAADYWPAVHRELALALDDLLVEDGRIASFEPTHPTFTAMGRFGNVLLANGEPDLALRARRGEVVRLYLTNTANTRVFNVALPGARMKLVGGDSGRYERETFVESVVLAPSERAVVDVSFAEAGALTLEHRTPKRTYALATITVEDEAVAALPTSFETLRTDAELAGERARFAEALSAPPDKTLAFVAEMDMGEAAGETNAYACPMHPEVTGTKTDRCPKCGMKLMPVSAASAPVSGHSHHAHGHEGHGDHGHHGHDDGPSPLHRPAQERAAVPAGIEWEDDMLEVNRRTMPANTRWKLIDRGTGAEGAAIDWRFRVGQRVKIRLVNEMDSDHPMQHPFHLHGAGRFLILSRDGVVEPNLVWKDTVLVPTGQTVDILFDVTHPGEWMGHCHIAEHHESGMMLGFRVDR